MKVILLQDVKKVGRRGEVREVKDGYAMNFLVARGLAKPASASALAELEILRKEGAAKDEEKKKEMLALKDKLAGMTLEIKVKAGFVSPKLRSGGAKAEKDAVMYASLHAKEILASLKSRGVHLEESQIVLEKPLKELGDYALEVDLGYGVKGRLNLHLVPDKVKKG